MSENKADPLREALEQIKTVCQDNSPKTCHHDMALDFVRQVATAALAAPQPAAPLGGRHPIEILWREHDLPEWFLGNGGTNTKLYALYDAIRALGKETGQQSHKGIF